MSGPKVVVLVTHEQMLVMAAALLKRLDQAIANWVLQGQGIDALSDDEIAATQRRRAALAALVETRDLIRLQKGVPDEISFLKADTERRQLAVVLKAEQAARRKRHAYQGAATVQSALAAKGVDVPQALREQLDAIAAGALLDDADAILARAFALLTTVVPAGLSDQQEALARGLRGDAPVQTWQQQIELVDKDPAVLRLDRQIAEASVYLDTAARSAFEARLRALEQEASLARRRLLLDSLILDLSAAIAAERQRQALREAVDELCAELEIYEVDEARAFVQQVRRADMQAPWADLLKSGQALAGQIQQRVAAQARRRAILDGLAKLGYEVHEGMETAWADQGRVVLKKASVPGYGVEIGGQSDRLQVRVVSTEAQRDVSRDRDVESMWCGEFGQLQALLAQQGDDLRIERALGVGEVPVKVVAEAGLAPSRMASDGRAR